MVWFGLVWFGLVGISFGPFSLVGGAPCSFVSCCHVVIFSIRLVLNALTVSILWSHYQGLKHVDIVGKGVTACAHAFANVTKTLCDRRRWSETEPSRGTRSGSTC